MIEGGIHVSLLKIVDLILLNFSGVSHRRHIVDGGHASVLASVLAIKSRRFLSAAEKIEALLIRKMD